MTKRVWVTILLIVIAISLAILFRSHSHELLLQGEADAPEVIVASKAKGRVIVRHVERGDDVQAGQVLITLESPELMAQLHALEAARDQAQAQLDQSLNGTREESIRSLRAELAQAQSQYDNAQRDYQRDLKVSTQGYLSASALDSAKRARDTAWQQVKAAKANLDEGLNGDRIEQRAAYAAAVRQAEQDIIEIKAQTDDLLVRAPVPGEVGPIPVEVGELQNAGSPLLTLIRLPGAYFVFNMREDIMARIHKGDRISLRVPALGNEYVNTEIRYIAPLGDYATKRATRATGDFDLKTFEVRLYPLQPVSGLRPGMSALWQWKE